MTTTGGRTPRVARSGAMLLVAGWMALSMTVGPFANAAQTFTAPGSKGATAKAKTTSHHKTKGPVFEVCPVDGHPRYMDDFGDARWFGGFHRHQGIDVFAKRNTPIRAPFKGRAETSTSWAGGLQVYVHGPKGFVFNAHLERVGKLGKVKAGTIVGYVGNSGDAQWSSTHDHFEWHPNGGPAVDPIKLLNAACRGKPKPPRMSGTHTL
jgi:peptidoglycan LD-endopeptidase LytH